MDKRDRECAAAGTSLIGFTVILKKENWLITRQIGIETVKWHKTIDNPS